MSLRQNIAFVRCEGNSLSGIPSNVGEKVMMVMDPLSKPQVVDFGNVEYNDEPIFRDLVVSNQSDTSKSIMVDKLPREKLGFTLFSTAQFKEGLIPVDVGNSFVVEPRSELALKICWRPSLSDTNSQNIRGTFYFKLEGKFSLTLVSTGCCRFGKTLQEVF